MNNRIQALLIATATATVVPLTPAQAAPACDDRIAIDNPARFPFETIAALRYDTDYDGDYEARGSAAVVGPYMALTCGHCVYNRSTGTFSTADIHIAPGMHQDDITGGTVYPFGRRIAKYKRTNTKWTDPTYSPESEVDYGSLGFVCPFQELTTYIPLVFDRLPGSVNMSGYPTEDLTDPTRSRDQWRGAGSVLSSTDRRLTYDVRSTGGASGAPVWEFISPDERRLVAVNRGHSTDCNGLGPRLVWQNEALILEWLSWKPTLVEQQAAGCAPARSMSWTELKGYYTLYPKELLSAAELRLAEPLPTPQAAPARSVVQVIENTLYHWEEYALEAPVPGGTRSLRMLKPQEKWLSVAEARALLSASRRWTQQYPSGAHTVRDVAATVAPLPSILTPAVEAGRDRVRDYGTVQVP